VTTYLKRDIYSFEGVKVRWNDGGHATLRGSIQFDMPMDVENLTALHTRYGSPDAVKSQVMQTVVNKVLYMTGPLMSSRESYAEKRTDVIRYVQDMIDNGVYRVDTRTVETTDQLSGQRTTAAVASIAVGADGTPIRQERSITGEFGIRTFNFSIESIDYDDAVEKQIAQQQQLIMDVQTGIAEARKAEQKKITTEQQGAALAAQAKWEQETIKA
jgi:regulator of protease activity HflC (stomatin/prohibitin superfamily)